jgi:ribonucleoside-diphosphate reductase alpha subunit
MIVIKRNNNIESVHFDKITERIQKLCKPPLDPVLVAQKVVANIYSGITTEELDRVAADICVNLSTIHPEYAMLGGNILASNFHKKYKNSFSNKMQSFQSRLHPYFVSFVSIHKLALDEMIDLSRDYQYNYFAWKTLERNYLLKSDTNLETPQDMWLRVAITMHLPFNGDSAKLEDIQKTYEFLSLGYYTHATPTLFNSGLTTMQLSSCFLLGTEDSLEEITNTWGSCSQISKWAGGIGLHVSNIRGKHSKINGTNGKSNGIVPLLRIFNDISRWIDQGGKRPGSIAIYLEPHHPDILDFLELRKNVGVETERARDLFLALWVSDLFMKQVERDGDWYLLSADECPGLNEVYGEQYERLYWYYVEKQLARHTMKARKLWLAILDAQLETGMPYISYKDAVNEKNNQKNLGTIQSSNLCNEINQFSNSKEYAVCNLASISLKSCIVSYVSDSTWTIYTKPDCKYCTYAKEWLTSYGIQYTETSDTSSLKSSVFTFPQMYKQSEHIGGWSELYSYTASTFDYNKLFEIAYRATKNLDHVIDINFYPVEQAKVSNMKHRPIGLGIQGLADVMSMMRILYESERALELNETIMETIYLAAMTASNDMAYDRCESMKQLILYFKDKWYPDYYDVSFSTSSQSIDKLYHQCKPNKYELSRAPTDTCGSYSSFEGSPFSKGIFQFDLWKVQPKRKEWDALKQRVMQYGTRNSLLTSLMPTASTSQILGNNECFEWFTNNIYTRKTNAGDFVMVNSYLVDDLRRLRLWSTEMKDKIMGKQGSVQTIVEIPSNVRDMYKTVWELKQVWVMKSAVARSPFVDQSQSMNLFMAAPDYQRLGSAHVWAWKHGLKTGMYYLRSKPSADAVPITVEPCTNCSA